MNRGPSTLLIHILEFGGFRAKVLESLELVLTMRLSWKFFQIQRKDWNNRFRNEKGLIFIFFSYRLMFDTGKNLNSSEFPIPFSGSQAANRGSHAFLGGSCLSLLGSCLSLLGDECIKAWLWCQSFS